MTTLDILARLIAFPTVSRDGNLALVDWVRGLLAGAGIAATVHPSPCGTKANLYARVGAAEGGVLLSCHSDVVPVDGQAWTRPPFALTAEGGRLHGRGTTDMKGFVACALSAMLAAARRPPARPLHFAMTYDEELGCLGAPGMIDAMRAAGARPEMCLVGEPTRMAVATGHKGKRALRATCRGVGGHSALAPRALNALHLGADFVAALRALQARIAAGGPRDPDYDVPYATVHAGRMAGGRALNIVPDLCEIDFEIRWPACDDPDRWLGLLRADADRIAAAAGRPEAAVEIETLWGYPGLGTAEDAPVVGFFRDLTGGNGAPLKVAYGAEAGLFAERMGLPTVVCGPGDMAQGHQPDEWIEASQLAACDAMLGRLLDRLAA
jgi:acetylornithine deacetylase